MGKEGVAVNHIDGRNERGEGLKQGSARGNAHPSEGLLI